MNADSRPGFFRRFLRALANTLFLIIVVGGLAVGGYFGIKELRRSFDSVTARIEINRRDLASLRSELDQLTAEAPGQRDELAGLRTSTVDLDERLNGLDETTANDLAEQKAMLQALEEELALAKADAEAALSSSGTASDDTAALGTALVALQGDLNEINSSIDALGGEIDGLRAKDEQLDGSLGEFAGAVDEAAVAAQGLDEMKQTLALFHVWELIGRARMRLFENNVGLAQADTQRAFRALDTLLPEEVDEADAPLAVVQTRLALALNSLPDDAASAARDLESAWDRLDRILVARVFPELTIAPAAGAAVETPAAAPAESTPEAPAEATPEATPEPTATPTG